MATRASYIAFNGAMPTTAPITPVTTGTATKTMLQIATPSTQQLIPTAWGVSFDGTALGNLVKCELIETDVAATVTAHVAAGVMPYGNPSAPASLVTLGTTATGYTATVEGTPAAVRIADYQQVQPTNQYIYQWPLGQEFAVAVSKFLRVRLTTAAAVNALCWVVWEA